MMVLCESESERWFYVRDRKGEKNIMSESSRLVYDFIKK